MERDLINEQQAIRALQYLGLLRVARHPQGEAGTVDARAALAMHHWMALNAIKAENRDEALHHVSTSSISCRASTSRR